MIIKSKSNVGIILSDGGTRSQDHQKLILNYLDRMGWSTDSIEPVDEFIIINLSVELEFKTIKLTLRFKPNGLWLSISTIMIQNIDKNEAAVYKRLLEINYTTTLTKFGLKESCIYALVELPLFSLDFEEFQTGLRRIVNDINKYFPIIAGILNG